LQVNQILGFEELPEGKTKIEKKLRGMYEMEFIIAPVLINTKERR